MTRSIHADTKTELAKQQYKSAYFVEVNLDTPLYFWTGPYDIIVGAKTYLGAGNLLDVNLPPESSDLVANGFSVSLSGIPSEMIAIALDEPIRGKECYVYSAVIADDGTMPGGLFLSCAGRCDTVEISEGKESSIISVAVENLLIRLNNPKTYRYTAEQQRRINPIDKSCDFIMGLAEKKIVWGAS